MPQTKFDKSTNEDTTIPDAFKWMWNNPKKVGMTALEMTPIIGEALLAKDAVQSFSEGDIKGGLIDTAALGVGVIPVVGDIVAKGIKQLKHLNAEDIKNLGIFNREEGFGSIGYQQAYEKRRRVKTVILPIDEARKLFPDRTPISSSDREYLDNMKNSILKSIQGKGRDEEIIHGEFKSKGVGVPFVSVDFDKRGNTLLSKAHEAAHRILALKELGHKFVPVDILFNKELDMKDILKNTQMKEAKNLVSVEKFARDKKKIQGTSANVAKDFDSIKPEDYDLKFNKGGLNMNTQTKMAFMQEGGGLKDDGMNRDPVSGNDIPSGSLAEEVRDDIPAMLSDGEYVVPADVVRFYGVKFFEDLRKKAKIGLAKMEEEGRIGGEPIAEESEEMMSPEEEQLILAITPEMNRGGVIKAAEGVMTDADIYKDAKLKAINPSKSDFSFVGGSLFDDNVPTGTTTRTYYHPDGRIQVVLYDANGNLVNPSDAEYTESPWSLTKPEAGSQDNLEATQPQDPMDTRDTGVQGFIEDRDRGIAKPFEEYSPLDFGDAAESFDGTLASVAKFTPLGAIAGISLEQGQEVADSILKSKQYKGRPLTNYEILQLERYKSTPKPENFLTNILNRLTGKEVEEESNKEDILTFEDKDGNLVSDTYANLLEKKEFQIPPFLDDKTIMNRSQLRDGQVPTEKGQKPTAQRQFETTGHALTKYGNVQFMPNDTGVRDMDLIRMEGADGKAQFIRRYELKKMLNKDRITSTDILNLDPSKIIRKPAGDDFYEDTLFGEYGQKLDNLLGVNRTDPEYKDDTPVVYESDTSAQAEAEAEQRRKAAMEAEKKKRQAEEEAKKQTQIGGQVAAGGGRWQAKQEEKARQAAKEKHEAAKKAKADAQKQQKDKTVYTGGGAGSGSGFALDKGGLASKQKPKKKRTTKGLGTKPKAT